MLPASLPSWKSPLKVQALSVQAPGKRPSVDLGLVYFS